MWLKTFVLSHRITTLSWTLTITGWIISFTVKDPAVAWSLRGASSLLTIISGVRTWRDLSRTPTTTPPHRDWLYSEPYADWQQIDANRPEKAIFSPALNRRLASGARIPVTVEGKWFPGARSAAGKKRRQWLSVPGRTNEKKLRLLTSLTAETEAVVLQETDYASFIVTNRLVYQQYSHDGHSTDLTFLDVEPGLRDPNGRLPRFEQSNCSNHIGGDIFLVGCDYVLVQQQNDKNIMTPGDWVATASGSFDLADGSNETDLQVVVKNGLLRELREECRRRNVAAPNQTDTKVIGFSRASYTGGKPQFYGVARTSAPAPTHATDIKTDKYGEAFKVVWFHPEERGAGLVVALTTFARQYEGKISPPLSMLIAVVAEWLQNDPTAEPWLFDSTA